MTVSFIVLLSYIYFKSQGIPVLCIPFVLHLLLISLRFLFSVHLPSFCASCNVCMYVSLIIFQSSLNPKKFSVKFCLVKLESISCLLASKDLVAFCLLANINFFPEGSSPSECLRKCVSGWKTLYYLGCIRY